MMKPGCADGLSHDSSARRGMNVIRWKTLLPEYYAYRPAKLLRWHPGMVASCKVKLPATVSLQGLPRDAAGVTVGLSRLSVARIQSIGWIGDVFGAPRMNRRVQLLGLHEWAMVYEAESIRHPAWPLRITAGKFRRY